MAEPRGLVDRLLLEPLRSLRRRSLYLIILLLYCGVIFGLVYTIEYAYYAEAKWRIITTRIGNYTFFDQSFNQRYDPIRQWVSSGARVPEEGAQPELLFTRANNAMQELFESEPTITSIRVSNEGGEIVFELSDRARIKKQNNFSNSFLDRRFERTIQNAVPDVRDNTKVRIIRINVTTPLNDEEITELTRYYHLFAFSLFLFITGLFYMMVRWNFIPVRRVTHYMQTAEIGLPYIVPNPRSKIESSYNDLARDATLTRLAKELRERIARHEVAYSEQLLERLPALMKEQLGVERCEVHIISRKTEADSWRVERVIGTNRDGEKFVTLFDENLLQMIRSMSPLDNEEAWSARVAPFLSDDFGDRSFFVDPIRTTQLELWLLVIHSEPKSAPPNSWRVDFYARAAQEVRFALSSIDDQRRMILQEKSKANISLSRNLGHDLTNIIATSKLDLMTVNQLLSLPQEKIKSSPAKEQLFRESLEGLLNNTRFLQEIVNIYRSFSFLQKPKFEEVNVSELVEDLVKLYRPTLSRVFRIETDVDPEVPPVLLEARLIRLALFNLITNAVDSLKRTATHEKAEGVITVSTRRASDNTVWIVVKDTGRGIRDSEGNLLDSERIAEIFRLGYSTKANQEGEGLGLNWVQTIIRDFHGGQLRAENSPEGGAAFTIELPVKTNPIKHSDDQISEQSEANKA